MDFATISVQCPQDLIQVIIAELFEEGFDSFQEFDEGFDASCDYQQFDEKSVRAILSKYSDARFSIREEDKTNWNQEWEKNYDPIIVADQCIVRATFHNPQQEFPFEIIVTPKMSFGTGHHATTYQMLAYQMTLDHKGKKVLDVGTGTGILAIMASKLGAKEIIATDIDDWCIENSEENFALNEIDNAKVLLGQIDIITDFDFDIVIANINKNVLADQMNEYQRRLNTDGYLLLSGFYKEDIQDLEKIANPIGLQVVKNTTKDNWAMLSMRKLA